MNYQFEVISTVNVPLIINVNNNITVQELRRKIVDEIVQSTIFIEEEILDIFLVDTLSTNTLSIPKTQQSIKDFIPMNRSYFPFESISKNTYKLYIIDRTYSERLTKCINDRKKQKREIRTNHFDFIRQIIPTWKNTRKLFK
jgi:hypothetical protein